MGKLHKHGFCFLLGSSGKSEEKLYAMLMQNLGGQTKSGIFQSGLLAVKTMTFFVPWLANLNSVVFILAWTHDGKTCSLKFEFGSR